ncbi:MAG: DUF1572 family protein [Cyclobacteriaceae bacterium]|nr:DUF1572 family protein [Cyclobacteriaceae bacterium]
MSHYLESVLKQFEYYKLLGEQTFEQVTDNALFWQPTPDSNSIAIIVQHLAGNMHSRFTDFLTTDGEKEWRNRDAEFEVELTTRQQLVEKWSAGWNTLLTTLRSLTVQDLDTLVYIRNQGHTVAEAINRQLAHYPYHIGQIVFIGKMCTQNWKSLSIPKGESKKYNADKFAMPAQRKHFTSEFLNPNN